jgi:hypothetical protein
MEVNVRGTGCKLLKKQDTQKKRKFPIDEPVPKYYGTELLVGVFLVRSSYCPSPAQ